MISAARGFTHPEATSCETIRETDGPRRRVMKAHWLLTDRAARWLMLVAVAMVVLLPAGAAQTPARGPLEVPARTLPVPTTVSPEMQTLIGAPLSATWNAIPKSADEWKAVATPGRGGNLPALRERFGVKAEPLTGT